MTSASNSLASFLICNKISPMQAAPLPPDEALRLAALQKLRLLDTPGEERFDRITRLAQRIFGVPVTTISLIDAHRQWYKSSPGLEEHISRQTPREHSFCGHTILGDEAFVVPDASQDERFADSPLVVGEPNIQFYAGQPLAGPDGFKVGALCLIDRHPREMSPEDLQTLRDLGAMVERELNLEEARESQKQLIQAREAAEQANRTTNTFLANMSHELHTPLNAIIGYSEMLIEEAADMGEKSFGDDLGKIRAAAQRLLGMIDDVLVVARRESQNATLKVEAFDVAEVLSEVSAAVQQQSARHGDKIVVDCPPGLPPLRTDRGKLRQILQHLLDNACKFTEHGTVTVRVHVDNLRYHFEVQDTGIGIAPEQIADLFKEFMQGDASTTRRHGGAGLGLAVCRQFCRLLGGDISVSSTPAQGSTFTFNILARIAATGEA